MPEIEHVRKAFRDWEDRGSPEKGAAAVAMVLRRGADGLEALFIERATREGDPWSGQMAFPGGRWEETDSDLVETAQRETLEELSVDLSASQCIGYLGDLRGMSRRTMAISGYIFDWDGPAPDLRPNVEVAAALWLPLRALRDPRRAVNYRVPYSPGQDFTGILVDGPHGEVDESRPGGPRVIWGLTHRFLREFHGALDLEFPVRPRRVPTVGDV